MHTQTGRVKAPTPTPTPTPIMMEPTKADSFRAGGAGDGAPVAQVSRVCTWKKMNTAAAATIGPPMDAGFLTNRTVSTPKIQNQ